MRVVRVLIDNSPDKEFDYAVPEGIADAVVMPGARVTVPLRNKRVAGTVTAWNEAAPLGPDGRPVSLRPIVGALNDRPLLSETLIRLARWIADYYCASLEATVRAMIPEAVRSKGEAFKTRKRVVLARTPSAEERAAMEKRARRQAAIVAQLEAAPEGVLLTDLAGAAAAVKALQEKGFVRMTESVVARDPYEDETFIQSGQLTLTDEQTGALDAVLGAVADPGRSKPLLLHGVTGSGKTEIYLQAAEQVLEGGRGVLVLVPEISLTPQTVERFKSRFAHLQNEVAVLHSHLSAGERHDEWHKVHRREARIVIGARSAVFAPLDNLGLIIVDEEHEPSYKQDSPPRYHARDVAVVRAKLEGAAILLGSATPSLESYHNTQTDKYTRLVLSRRVDGRTLPVVRVVDLRTESRKARSRKSAGPSVLSEPLRVAIDRRLESREQVILFINRRGFASSLQCTVCGFVCECAHCSVPLTFHKADDRLVCHLCGYRKVAPDRCPAPECGDPGIRYAGFGTERAEEQIRALLPHARIARVDADTMGRKNRLRDTLRDFKAQKIDLLVGTQMIAKGLDFPNVTLVGVLNADLGLHIPDFRAGERCFQLLTQVAGRAGRGELKGEVVVQTFTPHHPAIQFARHHDYEGYAEQELEFRKAFSYPPFAHCVLITSRSEHERRAEFTLENFTKRLRHHLPASTVLLGDPAPAPLARTQDQYRFQAMLRARNTSTMTNALKQTLQSFTLPSDVHLIPDVDAVNLM